MIGEARLSLTRNQKLEAAISVALNTPVCEAVPKSECGKLEAATAYAKVSCGRPAIRKLTHCLLFSCVLTYPEPFSGETSASRAEIGNFQAPRRGYDGAESGVSEGSSTYSSA